MFIQDIQQRVDHYHSLAQANPPIESTAQPEFGVPNTPPDSPLLAPISPRDTIAAENTSQTSLADLDTAETPSTSPGSPITPASGGSHRSNNSIDICSPTNTNVRSLSDSQSSLASERLLTHSHLKPGSQAELLSYTKTLSMYRDNAKRTNNPDVQCDFATFLVEAAQRLQKEDLEAAPDSRYAYLQEAEKTLRPIAMRGHSEAQYYLGNMYASGMLDKNNKSDFSKAFPLFVQAAKHHHADAAYRSAKCYEDGLGCRKDKAKAVQFYRRAASLNHPGAMYRLGLADLHGSLGMTRNVRDAHKWLKRSAEGATIEYPHALHELGLLHERGIPSFIFADHSYSVQLYKQAANLHYPPSAFRLGECYEFGLLGCQPNPRSSVSYYSDAAEQGHAEACLAMSAWYMVGVPEIIDISEESAYDWALQAAEKELPKAEYAVGYFCLAGIGRPPNREEAKMWYTRAANHGNEQALKSLHELERKAKAKMNNKSISKKPSLTASLSKRLSTIQPSWRRKSTPLEMAQ
ncbi:hypothetical protein CLU79DRAFT_743470 [Phycomyces nitens]|nr:hypothetical protein CLU79DRAFT_743470 [Phycomyces nitens]